MRDNLGLNFKIYFPNFIQFNHAFSPNSLKNAI